MANKRRCKYDLHQLESFCENFETIPSEELNNPYLEVLLAELERRWLKSMETFEDCILRDDKEQDENYQDDLSRRYDKICNLSQKTKAKILGLITSAESQRGDTTMVQPSSMTLKLPPCDIEDFEGGYSKWPAFRDLFQAVIGKHPHLAPAQKLYHLRSKTRGEANQIVKRFDLVDENFVLAWEALKSRFENPRILAHQQMKLMFGIQTAQHENAKSIRQIQSVLNESLAIFESLKLTKTWDAILIHLCASKLPEETMRSWENSLSDHKNWPTWQDMSDYLSKRIEMLETVSDMRKPFSKDSHSSRNQSFHSQSEEAIGKFNCRMCKQNHPLRFCKNFKALSVNDRIKFVYSNKFCVNCLSPSHFKSKCQSTNFCTRCNQKHHTMLHMEQKEKISKNKYSSNKSPSFPQNHERSNTNVTQQSTGIANNQVSQNESSGGSSTSNVMNHFSRNEGTTILPTALVNIEQSGQYFAVRALLDAGSEKTFISTRIQQNLSLPLERHTSQISGLGGTVVGNSNGRCTLTIKSRVSEFSIKVNAIVVPKLSHFLPSRPIKVKNLANIEEMDLADPYFFKPAAIDMIIGSDYLPFINLSGVKSRVANCLEARESQFGWYLSGPMSINQINTFSTLVHNSSETELQDQLKKFWELEETGNVSLGSESDKFCEDLYQRTTTRLSNGRFVVRLPFKEEFPHDIFLGHCRNMALAQYYRLEKTLEKTPEFKDEYTKVLQEYVDLYHMEPVIHFETKDEKQTSFYLPHHAVIRPDSKTTKLRVVFNASKKTSSGFSLNDVLHQGPTLQRDLMQVVLSWRHYQFVFTGDIQKMYRQILVHEDDRPYQQILFRQNDHNSVQSFQLKTVTFGVNCAPFLAIRTLQQLSTDCKNSYPMASNILKNEIYVDDILSGGHTLLEAKQKRDELIKALDSAGFPLKKITANEKFLLQDLSVEDLLHEDFLRFDDSSNVKTLGIRWNAREDYFYYVIELIEISTITTKRQILSVIAKLFDPLGWLGPIVVIAKLLIQELWKEKSGWDDAVPPPILDKWKLFVENFQTIGEIKIPRWVHFAPQYKVQIHGFCDASEKAYCGMIFMRTESSEGVITTHLLVAKTKVAPLKRTTVPKLELCGALLLTKLYRNLIMDFKFSYELFMWTDSSIVLGWLQKDPNSLKTFVGNRVAQILSIVSTSQWKHVKTEENPADLGSRGCYPQELILNPLWWKGPSWLQLPIVLWPTPRTFHPHDLESKKSEKVVHLNSQILNFNLKANNKISDLKSSSAMDTSCDILENFSSIERAFRVISYCFRFIHRIMKKSTATEKFITAKEIAFTKNRLMLNAQQMYFPKEYESLREKRPLSQRSRLLTLNPFIDENNLMRVRGRLSNMELRFEEQHPIIIPEKSRFSILLIEFTHRVLLHAEHHSMLRAIRQGFYIPRLKNCVRQCIRNCKACTIYKKRFHHQIMAALPPERVNFSLPFTYTGVDFAGPFNIKSSNLRNAKILKGYVAVFVCFSTRAVHLEMCSDLSADAILACFDRFTGRRGLPKTLFSDNGRNFLGASYALLKSHNLFLKTAEQALVNKYSSHGFTWSFIPPYAPHMGGIWEAAVKSMKSHLKKTTNNLSFTFEEFSTLLIRIEAVLNSRPLSPITENPNEILPLTPGHLLRGAPIIAQPEAPSDPPLKDVCHLKRWERLKAIQHIFAKRWKNEYITEMQRRNKWKTEGENIAPNDIVIVKEDLLPPTEWRLGRVTNVIYGNDKKVRVVDVLTQNGTIRRPIVKLCKLPITSNSQNFKPE